MTEKDGYISVPIEMDDETFQKLSAQAEKAGMTVDAYASMIIEEELKTYLSFFGSLTDEQKEKALSYDGDFYEIMDDPEFMKK